MSELKTVACIRQNATTTPGNHGGDTHAEATLAQQSIQPADVVDAVTWVRQPANVEHDQHEGDHDGAVER
jgi:hypothetical protein